MAVSKITPKVMTKGVGPSGRAIEIASDPRVKSHGQVLLELALRASSEVHTYLKFYGD